MLHSKSASTIVRLNLHCGGGFIAKYPLVVVNVRADLARAELVPVGCRLDMRVGGDEPVSGTDCVWFVLSNVE
jgi:hypothetical protein